MWCGQCSAGLCRNNNDWLLPEYTCAAAAPPLPADMEVRTARPFSRIFFQICTCFGGSALIPRYLVLSNQPATEWKMYTWPDFCGWQELQVVPLASCKRHIFTKPPKSIRYSLSHRACHMSQSCQALISPFQVDERGNEAEERGEAWREWEAKDRRTPFSQGLTITL